MDKLFRTLIITSVVLYLAFHTMPYLDYTSLTENELDLLSWGGYNSTIPGEPYTSYAIAIIWLCISISLFFYINIARLLFAIMLIFTAILSPFTGYAVYTAIGNTIVSILEMIDGALLIMMYFTSVSTKFTKAPNKALNTDSAKNAAPVS